MGEEDRETMKIEWGQVELIKRYTMEKEDRKKVKEREEKRGIKT